MSKSLATDTNFDYWLDCHVRSNKTSCMHIKNRNKLKWTQNRISVCYLRKILLVCAFCKKIKFMLCIGVMLPKFCKSLFILFCTTH
jgi:hypothetical protein